MIGKSSYIISILAAVLLATCQTISQSALDYFGMTPPGGDPEIFAPGVISLPGRWEGNAVLAPDGNAFYFNVFEDGRKSIYYAKRNNGQWNTPEPLSILGEENNWEPFVTPDGKTLYFVSSRPPGSEEWNGRIWRSDMKGGQWTAPGLVAFGHDTDGGYWFPNEQKSGNFYFGGNFTDVGNLGKGDGYMYSAATKETVNITAINTEHEEWDPYTDPDENYILWASDRPGGFGGTDLYISFKTQSGDWGEAINLGPKINTADYEVAARLSPDGRYMFFDRPKAGTQDIYWVSMDEILALNPDTGS